MHCLTAKAEVVDSQPTSLALLGADYQEGRKGTLRLSFHAEAFVECRITFGAVLRRPSTFASPARIASPKPFAKFCKPTLGIRHWPLCEEAMSATVIDANVSRNSATMIGRCPSDLAGTHPACRVISVSPAVLPATPTHHHP